MNRKDKSNFTKDVDFLYKVMMTEMGKRWSKQLSPEEIRAELTLHIVKHNHERLLENAKQNKKLRKQRASTIKELKGKIDKLKGLIKEEPKIVQTTDENTELPYLNLPKEIEQLVFNQEDTDDVFQII